MMDREQAEVPREASASSLHEQLATFERDNPSVAEAMRLFGMSLEEYQIAITAMNGVQVTTSSSTTPDRFSPLPHG